MCSIREVVSEVFSQHYFEDIFICKRAYIPGNDDRAEAMRQIAPDAAFVTELCVFISGLLVCKHDANNANILMIPPNITYLGDVSPPPEGHTQALM